MLRAVVIGDSMKKNVYAYIHTHWDREWYRNFEEFRVRLVDIFDDILNKLNSNELENFYFDGQTAALEDYLLIKPQNEELVKNFIKQKRLYIGPYYCSTDSFLVDSEALIKNLQLGINYSKDFGCNDFIAYHADTFGHSKYLPSIIKYFNIKNAIFWRGLGELESEFKFNGLDSIYLIEGYFHDYFVSDLSFEKKVEFLKRTLDRISFYSGENILLPIGADHLCTPDKIKEQIDEINKVLSDYNIVLSTPFDYIKKVEKRFKKDLKQEFRDTKRNFILPGVLSSRLDLKHYNNKLQWRLARILQPFAAVANCFSKKIHYQSEIDYAYKLLLENQAHDSIYGCSIDSVHSENISRYKKVESVLNAVENSIKTKLEMSNAYGLLNLSNYDFNGAIDVYTTSSIDKSFKPQLIEKIDGFPFDKLYPTNKIPITEDYTKIYHYLLDVKNIQSFAYKNILKQDISEKSDLKITEKSIENSYVKLAIVSDKIVLTDKISGKKYTDFINFIDRADAGDSYNFGSLKNDKPLKATLVSSKIILKGHIRSVLQVQFELQIPHTSNLRGRSSKLKKHLLNLKVILDNQNDFLEFKLDWENKSQNHILQLELKFDKPIDETVSDDLVGYIKRDFDPNYDVSKLVPAKRGVELKHNTAPIQRFVFAQGVGLITKGLPEYEVFKNRLRLTLLRATGLISNPHNPTRGTPAGPPLPTPDLQQIGENTARFAISFKDLYSQIEQCVEKFYGAQVVCGLNENDVKLFDSGNENLLVNTVKLNNNGDFIVRFVNKSDEKQYFDFSTNLIVEEIYETDSMEKPKQIFRPFYLEPNTFVTLLLVNAKV